MHYFAISIKKTNLNYFALQKRFHLKVLKASNHFSMGQMSSLTRNELVTIEDKRKDMPQGKV